MAKTAEQILSDLKNNNYAPVYFLQGEEPYFIDLISDYIEANALDESEKGFNQRVLYGKDVGLYDVISAAKSFPMMGQRQVIIVKEAQMVGEVDYPNLIVDVVDVPLKDITVLQFIIFLENVKNNSDIFITLT